MNSPTSNKIKAYGEKFAMTIERATTTNEAHSIIIEIAKVKMVQSGKKEFNWNEKMQILLSEQELNLFAGLLLGYLPSVKFERPNDNKWVEFTRQKKSEDRVAGGIFVKGFNGELHTLPIVPGVVCEIAQLCLGQLERRGLCSPELLIAAIRGGCALIGSF